jgi:HSP20 family protein
MRLASIHRETHGAGRAVTRQRSNAPAPRKEQSIMATAQMTPSRPATPARTSRSAPSDLFQSLHDTMDRLTRDLGFMQAWPFERQAGPAADLRWIPDLEVQERDGLLHVRADLPGLGKDDVKVEIADGVLTLEGERTHTADEKKDGYYRTERAYGRFSRRIALPEGADPDTASASFKDGVLEVTVQMPKPSTPQRRRLDIG